jgi:hypothetical protein
VNTLFQEDTRIKRIPLYVGGKISVSLPLTFSKGGWNTDVKPSLSFASSSDLYYFPAKRVYYDKETGSYNETADNYMSGVSSSVMGEARISAVTKLTKSPSQAIPRLGFGTDLSLKSNLMTDAFYAHAYCYLPGLFRTQGLKLAAEYQTSPMDVVSANTYWPSILEDLAPRGLTDDGIGVIMNRLCPSQVRFSADYVIQAFSIDSHITPYFYIRNFEFVPFVDFTRIEFLENPNLPSDSKNLYSVGVDFNVRFEKLLMLANTWRFGIRTAYNGGSGYDYFANTLGLKRPLYVGFIMNTDL